MPPRRRTFYLADATVLSNSKVRGLSRQHPDQWLAAWGAFHVLIGVATISGSPRLSSRDLEDVLGPENLHLVGLLRSVGLLGRFGIDPETYEEWCPKARPKYPSDYRGVRSDSDGITSDSGGVSTDSDGIPTSSTSSVTTATPSSRGAGRSAVTKDDLLKQRDDEDRAELERRRHLRPAS